VSRYLAHRREDPAKLARIADLAGVEVLRPALPLELVLRAGPVARTVVSFPSTVVHTLPVVLAGTGAEVLVHEPAGDWLVPGTPERAAGSWPRSRPRPGPGTAWARCDDRPGRAPGRPGPAGRPARPGPAGQRRIGCGDSRRAASGPGYSRMIS
jgi:hypothetical protein